MFFRLRTGSFPHIKIVIDDNANGIMVRVLRAAIKALSGSSIVFLGLNNGCTGTSLVVVALVVVAFIVRNIRMPMITVASICITSDGFVSFRLSDDIQCSNEKKRGTIRIMAIVASMP